VDSASASPPRRAVDRVTAGCFVRPRPRGQPGLRRHAVLTVGREKETKGGRGTTFGACVPIDWMTRIHTDVTGIGRDAMGSNAKQDEGEFVVEDSGGFTEFLLSSANCRRGPAGTLTGHTTNITAPHWV